MSKPFKLALTLSLLVTLPLSVFLVQRVVRYLSRAGEGMGPSVLTMLPADANLNLGEITNLSVALTPNGVSVTSVEMVIDYDPSIITVRSIEPGSFFTQYTGGDPFVIDRSEAGRIHFTVTFPIGSQYSSSANGDAAVLEIEAINNGTTNINFVTSGVPNTIVLDNSTPIPQEVLDYASGSTVTVGGISTGNGRLYFSPVTPPNPQSVDDLFTVSVLLDTGGESVDAVDALVNFDTAYLEAVSVTRGNVSGFTSYPCSDNINTGGCFDNNVGRVTVSPNVGTGSYQIPPSGTGLNLAEITFRAVGSTNLTTVDYEFVAEGNRNDSNVVLAGTLQTADPTDLLTSVSGVDVTVSPTTLPTATPTPTSTPPPGTIVFQEEFNDAVLDPDKWDVFLNNGTYSLNGESIVFPGGADQPFIRTKDNPFPLTGEFELEMGIQYTSPNGAGSGVSLSFVQQPNTPAWDNQPISIWQDNCCGGFRVLRFGTNAYIFSLSDTSYHTVRIHYDGSVFNVYLDDQLRYTTPQLDRPGGLWLGHPNHDADNWTGFNVDFLRVRSEVPVVTPTPTSPPGADVTLDLITGFQGRLYQGADRTKGVEVVAVSGGNQLNLGVMSTNANGVGQITVPEGDYYFLLKTSGYLAKRYGSLNNPYTIIPTTTSIDLSYPPLVGGDYNGDGVVNEIDYTLKYLVYFQEYDEATDLDASGVVNSLDFAIMRSNWGLSDDTL
jgi:hypothetical protein